jgi:predicted metal-dependent hydrolase
VQLRLPWAAAPTRPNPRVLSVGDRTFTVEVVRRRGARRYIVRVSAEAVVRITVPFGAPIAGGVSFAERQAGWIAREWERQQERLAPWRDGTTCWFRGAPTAIRLDDGRVRIGDEDAGRWSPATDVRAVVLARLAAIAAAELPVLCRELAASAGIRVSRVSVRNQRSRWGACSSRGTITLNWRLVQVPVAVRDYVIWHELAHLAVPNHSRRFWREVERLCPTWRDHERWLKSHEGELF